MTSFRGFLLIIIWLFSLAATAQEQQQLLQQQQQQQQQVPHQPEATTCVVDPNYCTASIQQAVLQVQQQAEQDLNIQLATLRQQLEAQAQQNLDACKESEESAITQQNIFRLKLDRAEREKAKADEAFTEQVQQLQDFFGGIIETKTKELNAAIAKIEEMQKAEETKNARILMLKEHNQQLLSESKKIIKDNDKYKRKVDRILGESIDLRREMLHYKETLQRPLERRLKYQRYLKQLWNTVLEHATHLYEKTKELAIEAKHYSQLAWKITNEKYFEVVEPRRQVAVQVLTDKWNQFLQEPKVKEIKSKVQQHLETGQVTVQKHANKLWDDTSNVRAKVLTNSQKVRDIVQEKSLQFWEDTRDTRERSIEKSTTVWNEHVKPVLDKSQEAIIDFVWMVIDYKLAFLKLYQAPQVLIDVNTAAQENVEDIVLLMEILVAAVVLEIMIVKIIGSLFFGSSRSAKRPTPPSPKKVVIIKEEKNKVVIIKDEKKKAAKKGKNKQG